MVQQAAGSTGEKACLSMPLRDYDLLSLPQSEGGGCRFRGESRRTVDTGVTKDRERCQLVVCWTIGRIRSDSQTMICQKAVPGDG